MFGHLGARQGRSLPAVCVCVCVCVSGEIEKPALCLAIWGPGRDGDNLQSVCGVCVCVRVCHAETEKPRVCVCSSGRDGDNLQGVGGVCGCVCVGVVCVWGGCW